MFSKSYSLFFLQFCLYFSVRASNRDEILSVEWVDLSTLRKRELDREYRFVSPFLQMLEDRVEVIEEIFVRDIPMNRFRSSRDLSQD